MIWLIGMFVSSFQLMKMIQALDISDNNDKYLLYCFNIFF